MPHHSSCMYKKKITIIYIYGKVMKKKLKKEYVFYGIISARARLTIAVTIILLPSFTCIILLFRQNNLYLSNKKSIPVLLPTEKSLVLYVAWEIYEEFSRRLLLAGEVLTWQESKITSSLHELDIRSCLSVAEDRPRDGTFSDGFGSGKAMGLAERQWIKRIPSNTWNNSAIAIVCFVSFIQLSNYYWQTKIKQIVTIPPIFYVCEWGLVFILIWNATNSLFVFPSLVFPITERSNTLDICCASKKIWRLGLVLGWGFYLELQVFYLFN